MLQSQKVQYTRKFSFFKREFLEGEVVGELENMTATLKLNFFLRKSLCKICLLQLAQAPTILCIAFFVWGWAHGLACVFMDERGC